MVGRFGIVLVFFAAAKSHEFGGASVAAFRRDRASTFMHTRFAMFGVRDVSIETPEPGLGAPAVSNRQSWFSPRLAATNKKGTQVALLSHS